MLSSIDVRNPRSPAFRWARVALIAVFAITTAAAWAQESAPADGEAGPVAAPENEAFNRPAPADSSPAPSPPRSNDQINFFALLAQGGAFMWPILGMSLIAVTFAIERFINLRRSKVMPPQLAWDLGQLGMTPGAFDPRAAYRVCQQYPSNASNVIRSMLLKVGRPHSEVEQSVRDGLQREAENMYANVRWLNVAVAVTPLIGLLGTVWGMILCFHQMTTLAPGANRAVELAEGIYVALVTTLGGLLVAIPAAVVAHILETRIQKMAGEMEEMAFGLLPQVERFEGRLRFAKPSDLEGAPATNGTGSPPPAPATAPPRVPAPTSGK